MMSQNFLDNEGNHQDHLSFFIINSLLGYIHYTGHGVHTDNSN
jgi:hypothetical protein